MTPTQYETTLVIDAHMSNEQIDASVEKYTKLITDNDGAVRLIDRWGKRRLAYEISKKQYGFYVYIRFEAPGTLIKQMERDIKLDDSILRHLTVIVPKAALKNEALKDEAKEQAEVKTDAEAEKPASEMTKAAEEKPESEAKAGA